ncbi:MAG TPA: choice-of-anchor D domain-containing protein [Kofleriaceae bacterium]|nr:choice-of-anchor D domain-containing protein [Kofleriaceae bacterium]
MGKRFFAVVVVIASACTALHYSTAYQESVVVSQSSYTFPGPGSQPFTISAGGSGADDNLVNVRLEPNCSTSVWSLWLDPTKPFPYRICGGAILNFNASGSGTSVCPTTYTFYANFNASLPGLSTCAVAIDTMSNLGSSSETQYINLSGSGSGVSGISAMPSSIDFADVQINTTSTASSVTVKNLSLVSGTTVTGTLTGTGFVVTGSYTSFGLGPGSSVSFPVTCHPTVVGPLTGRLEFAGAGSSAGTKLDCNGIDSTVTIAPSQINFDPTLVGRAPPRKTVGISGASTAVIENVSLDSAAQMAGVTITMNPQGQQVGGGKTIELDYSAMTAHEAGPLGTLSVKVSVDQNPRMVNLAGTALIGGVGTNPATVEFGAVCAGSKVMKDVEVYANEAGDVSIVSLTKPAAPFDAMAVEPLPKMVMGGHSGPSVTVRASLMPTGAGEVRDAFALVSNVPNHDPYEVQLHGTGLASGIAATPDLVHFGTAAAGTTTSIKEVQFTNCGTSDLMFNGAALAGRDHGEFTIIGANPPRVLHPTESEIIMVVMQPESPGEKQAQLVISHDQGTTPVDLDGTGEGGANKERETYYACSTGRSGSLWLIALALLALRRRRR